MKQWTDEECDKVWMAAAATVTGRVWYREAVRAAVAEAHREQREKDAKVAREYKSSVGGLAANAESIAAAILSQKKPTTKDEDYDPTLDPRNFPENIR